MKINHNKKMVTFEIRDTYNDYLKQKLKKKDKISFTEYRQIIAKFLRVWLYSFLTSKGDHYFLFGWNCRKYLSKEKYTKDKTGKVVFVPNKIGILWKPLNIGPKKRMISARVLKDKMLFFYELETKYIKENNLDNIRSLAEEKALYKQELKENGYK